MVNYAKMSYLHDLNELISLTGDAWFARTGLTLACFIEMHVTRQENERLCICVLISLYDFNI